MTALPNKRSGSPRGVRAAQRLEPLQGARVANEAGPLLMLAAEMADAGVAMTRESLRRRFPQASEAELDSIVAEVAARRPLDGPGVRAAWPRR